MTRILVTGSKGVLGSILTPHLLEAGYTVRGTSRRPPTATDISPSWQQAIEWQSMDIIKGYGLDAAVEGVDIIIHAASNPARSKQADAIGTIRLLEQAEKARVGHFIYVSIVGIDRIPLGYYQHKLATEKRIEQATIPWSILRATQFHTLLDMALNGLTRLPILPLPLDFQFQLLDAGEAAQRLVEIVQTGPGERYPDIGGPETLTLAEITQTWLAAQGLN